MYEWPGGGAGRRGRGLEAERGAAQDVVLGDLDRSRPNSRSTSIRITTPATIVGARSGCRPGDLPALARASATRGARAAASQRRRLEHVAVDPLRVVGVERPGRSPRARSPCRRPRSRADGAAPVARAPRARYRAHVARRARRARRQSADRSARWRSVWRTTPACVETANSASRPRADDELGRAAADVDHERRRRGRPGRARWSRRGTSAGPPRRR